MTAKDVVRKIMADKGFSQEKLAAESGMKRQSNVTGILNRGTSLRVDTLDQLVSAMGYKIVLMPADVCMRDGWFEVDDSRVIGEEDN